MNSKILVVDDSRMIRNHVRRILDSGPEEYEVIEQADGHQALNWLSQLHQQEFPDLILLDRNMPKMSGDECIRILKKDEDWKRIPVLFLTAQVEMSQLVKGLAELEAEDYLPKPFDPDELLARIKVLIRIKHAEDLTHQLNRDLEKSLVLQKKAYEDLKETKIRLAETEAIAKLTGIFEKFVPKEFLTRIAPDGLENLRFGHAESDNITILFSDIRSFTEISESYSPQELMDFLNGYLKQMNPPIMENHGFVDKFIGDAIMAVFDSPDQSDAEEARNAIDAALGMQKMLAKLNVKRRKQKLTPVAMGIGIHSGNVIIGTIGFEERMDSTVLGDAVNLASRLEGLTKHYGCPVIISNDTFDLLENRKDLLLRELDRVMVKGRQAPVTIYEVFNGDAPALKQAKQDSFDIFEDGLACYRKRQWKKGLQAFEDCHQGCPQDAVFPLYAERCRQFLKNPPPRNWDGIYTFTQK
ncbi:MAG TPA: response regulator [Deltaproteobacteria bacterium]|jgi:class 3 adenylate cyclase/CheY-like chemotaxis protein|nr:response regulator [Candidatus Lambdaproteobacteria bacterium]HIL15016.1 response regulator [Deltaproteobacteria bacterium]